MLNINITPAAQTHINKLLQADVESCYFHLKIKKTGCNGYMYVPSLVASKKPGDVLVALNYPFEILVPEKNMDLMHNTQVDFVEKQFGMKQLTFTHPKAAGVCGCGESFNFVEEDNE